MAPSTVRLLFAGLVAAPTGMRCAMAPTTAALVRFAAIPTMVPARSDSWRAPPTMERRVLTLIWEGTTPTWFVTQTTRSAQPEPPAQKSLPSFQGTSASRLTCDSSLDSRCPLPGPMQVRSQPGGLALFDLRLNCCGTCWCAVKPRPALMIDPIFEAMGPAPIPNLCRLPRGRRVRGAEQANLEHRCS